MNITDILDGARQASADYHIAVARVWRDFGRDAMKPSPLVYAAFEYRCGIERVLMELYSVMHDVLPGVEDIKRIKTFYGVITRLTEMAGGNGRLLLRALTFNQILSGYMRLRRRLSIPNVGRLEGFWQRLSEYCHRQVSPSETWDSAEWVRRGYQLLDEVEAYLNEILIEHSFGAIPDASLPIEVWEAKQAFIREEIDEAGLRARLDLMDPILRARLR